MYRCLVTVSGVGWCGDVEFLEEAADAVGDAAVSFDFAGLAAFGGVGDELLLGAQAFQALALAPKPTRDTLRAIAAELIT